MSRGHGALQRLILDAIEKPDMLVPLSGNTRSERRLSGPPSYSNEPATARR